LIGCRLQLQCSDNEDGITARAITVKQLWTVFHDGLYLADAVRRMDH
jgi:hypothetical protein